LELDLAKNDMLMAEGETKTLSPTVQSQPRLEGFDNVVPAKVGGNTKDPRRSSVLAPTQEERD
jgi:hypothetical protein